MVAPSRSFSAADTVRVHVIGRDPLVRNGLVGLLSNQPAVDVVGDTAPGAELPYVVHVVVRDGGPTGVDADLSLDVRSPHLVLVPDANGASRALRAGARGVLRRDAEAEHLVAAVRAVAAGLVVHDPGLTVVPRRLDPDPLSPREHEVLALVAEGLPNKLIADRLHISEHTAKFHVNAILDKLGVAGRTEAVVFAARQGWLTL